VVYATFSVYRARTGSDTVTPTRALSSGVDGVPPAVCALPPRNHVPSAATQKPRRTV
jgi:hypothetical protein